MPGKKKGNFVSTGVMYAIDKGRIFSRNPSLYLKPVVVWISTGISLILSTYALVYIDPGQISYLLIVYLFLVFCYASIQSTLLERYELRYARECESHVVLHDITHAIRDYRAQKIKFGNDGIPDGVPVYNGHLIKHAIDMVCEKLRTNYLKPRHGDVTLCLKYYIHEEKKMCSFRYGPGAFSRSNKHESMDECHVFNVLKEKQKKILYVHDTEDEDELRYEVGDCFEKIRHRAKVQGYRSFFALPIQTGEFIKLTKLPIKIKIPLGFLGCDHPLKNGISIGNLPDHEIEFLGTVVDALSELLFDLKFVSTEGEILGPETQESKILVPQITGP